MSDVILSDKTLSSSAFSHVIAVPIEKIDIAEWLFNLPEAEYQRCCAPDHISCGATITDDGTRMSINVEMVGQTLMIQWEDSRGTGQIREEVKEDENGIRGWVVCARAGLLLNLWSQPFYSLPLTYFKGESASSGSSFPRCSFVLSIIQGAGANAYAS